nr:3-phosphoinositide-dependent protein kinase 2-like isoform X2 [Tanacetum cinerariifolium]
MVDTNSLQEVISPSVGDGHQEEDNLKQKFEATTRNNGSGGNGSRMLGFVGRKGELLCFILAVGLQWFSFVFGADSYYSKQIAPSRTFCVYEEVSSFLHPMSGLGILQITVTTRVFLWRKCVVQGSAVYVGKVTNGYKSNGGQMNKFATNVSVTSDSVSGPTSSQMIQMTRPAHSRGLLRTSLPKY